MSTNLDRQERNREQLYIAHRKTRDRWWADEGNLTYHNPEGVGSYRAYLWHGLAYPGCSEASCALCVPCDNRDWHNSTLPVMLKST